MGTMETLAKRLTWIRLRRGLTQAELSDLCGIATSTIGNLETGYSQGSKKMVELAAALCVSKDWLANGVGEPAIGTFQQCEVESWKTRLREARRQKGMTRNDLAKTVNVSNSTVTNWEKSSALGGSKQISDANAEAISQALEVNWDWILYGSDSDDQRDDDERSEDSDSETVTSSTLLVPRVRVHVDPGSEMFEVQKVEDVRDTIPLDPRQLGKRIGTVTSLLAVSVVDDSMSPMFCKGDDVIINVADIAKEDGKYFAVNESGRLLIRRLVFLNSKWVLTNESHKTELISAESTPIIGRVVYRMGCSNL